LLKLDHKFNQTSLKIFRSLTQNLLSFFLVFLAGLALFNTSILASGKNIFGLHLTQTSDIHEAAKIINSAGGDWGWVTIVIRLDQLDHSDWQQFFDNCRKYHLQPLIRLATAMQPDCWQKPTTQDIDRLAEFLNSLNWPVKNQYIIVFNEPNHATEWGGRVDPQSYADISVYAYDKFKSLNPNFQILGPSLDQASPSQSPQYESVAEFLKKIYQYRPEYFQKLDGIASHSYPNNGFVGSPKDTGVHSIVGFQWELDFIKNLGVTKTYPVFITETGWPHREGQTKDNRFYTCSTSASYLHTAYDIWGKYDSVQAVTPFIFNYPNPPFDHFSWLNEKQQIYAEYQPLINRPKLTNDPPQIVSYQSRNIHFPFLIFSNNEYLGEITLKNTGQSIWGEKQFCLSPQSTPNVVLDAICTGNNLVYPGQEQKFSFKFKINPAPDFKSKTFISWDGLPPFEITPFSGTDRIYHPNTGFFSDINNFFRRIFN
jgi:hypothetical protein